MGDSGSTGDTQVLNDGDEADADKQERRRPCRRVTVGRVAAVHSTS
jgi:hypothetical protein